MAPINRTPEYDLLTKLMQAVEAPAIGFNQLVLQKAIDDGYVKRIGEYVFITSDGVDRLDKLDG